MIRAASVSILVLSFFVQGCFPVADDAKARPLAPMAQLGAAIEAGEVARVRDLGRDKFAFIRIEQGTAKAQIGKINFQKFGSALKSCKVLFVREDGEKTPQGYPLRGGDLQVSCGEIVKGCGPSIINFMTDGPLGEEATKVEFQHVDRNRCTPDATMLTDSSVNA
jgi:hypothetical protein